MRTIQAALAVTLLGLGGCGSTAPSGPGSASLSVAAGQPFSVHLGTVGPGDYLAPPVVSSAAIQFVAESLDTGVQTPGGERQVFYFLARSPGLVSITFTHAGSSLPGGDSTARVTDWVAVR